MTALSEDQQQAFEAVLAWLEGRDSPGLPRAKTPGLFTIGGYAGTGKSYLIGALAAEFSSRKMTVAYVAVTGRASSVLNRKLQAAEVALTDKLRRTKKDSPAGHEELFDDRLALRGGPAFCGTLHRLIYRPLINDEEELLGWRVRATLDRKYDLLVVDEASMLSREMYLDLVEYRVPILAVGDHGQLPPVASSGSVVESPDFCLSRIHRQALESPIIRLAAEVRAGEKLARGWGQQPAVTLIEKALLRRTLSRIAAEVREKPLSVGLITWQNKTRIWLNQAMRGACGRRGVPRYGEPVLCLKNAPPVFNGMRGVLVEDARDGEVPKKPWILRSEVSFPDEGLARNTYDLCGPQFNREKPYGDIEEMRNRGMAVSKMSEAGLLFDFGYCLTAHRAQGSEFDLAVVYLDRREEPASEEWRRWIYTSATRAKDRLIILG